MSSTVLSLYRNPVAAAVPAGASAGIGWAVCEVLAAAGIRVVAVARRRERLEALQQTLVSQGVPIADFLPIVCDITKASCVGMSELIDVRTLNRRRRW